MKKTLWLVLILCAAVACKNDSKNEQKEGIKTADFTTEKISLDSTDVKDCQDRDCPKLEINYVKLKGDNDFIKAVNKENEQEIIRILHIDEEQPQPKSIEGALASFAEAYHKLKEMDQESSISYEAKIDQEILNDEGGAFVVQTGFYLFTGGAHGYSGTHFTNFDPQTGEVLTKEDLISDEKAFTDYVEKAFRLQYEIPSEADINEQGFFFEDGKFVLPENMAVTKDSVILIYNPYEAASYSEGQLRFLFPKKEVGKWLNY